MDEDLEKKTTFNSSDSVEELSPIGIELSKKRKLSHLIMPVPKHKFRDRSSSYRDQLLTPESLESDENSPNEVNDTETTTAPEEESDIDRMDEESNKQISGDDLQFDPQCKDMNALYPGIEAYDDHTIAEFAKLGLMISDAVSEDAMHCSNDISSNMPKISSAQAVGHDARLGASKTTIDQEFEQYFSMLML
ncbi:uncharacterized protein [Typha angustifolia]|uniref:uncharacterized protein n=1 Tax=Typha angustifolia TaxID=59011 RepID=UPI003C30B3FD